MIESFGDRGNSDLYHGRNTNRVRRFPPEIKRLAIRKLDVLNADQALDDLREMSGNRLKSMKGEYAGYNSIRINDQWRIVFQWRNNDAYSVSLTDYH